MSSAMLCFQKGNFKKLNKPKGASTNYYKRANNKYLKPKTKVLSA